MDSFNILAPHPNKRECPLYEDYFEARGGQTNTVDSTNRAGIGLTGRQMVQIDGTSQKIEGCDVFGVNSHLRAFKDIYKEGKGLFFANSEYFRHVRLSLWFYGSYPPLLFSGPSPQTSNEGQLVH